MKRILAALICLSFVLAAGAPLAAKGATVKITISGVDLPAPLEIREPSVIKPFQVWSGPGVRMIIGGVVYEETEGFIIDWPARGVATPPSTLPHYDVSFYVDDKRAPEATTETLAYIVSYAYDPASGRDFVYLPGKNDQWYELNASHMSHPGFEGKWFGATDAWQRVARSLLAGKTVTQ